MPATFVYGQVTLDFSVGNRVEKATFRYRYYPESKRVEYVSVECTDPSLKEKVHSSPAMRERVDEYVRKQLARRDEGLS